MLKWSLIKEILKESFFFALNGLKNNILRTILSTLGIIIGVFMIIIILTFIDSLNKSVRDSLAKLGGDVIYIEKWPWTMKGEYTWWKFLNRPQPTYNEMQMLKSKMKNYDAIAFGIGISDKTIYTESDQIKHVSLMAYSHDFYKIFDLKFNEGRYFSEIESQTGDPKIILGHEIASRLFQLENPVGQQVKLFNTRFKVIGVLQKEGNSAVDINNFDQVALIPYAFARKLYSSSNLGYFNSSLVIKGNGRVDIDRLESEITGSMRSIRKLTPLEEENFAVNKVSNLNDKLNEIFKNLSIGGWIIAAFSILVGGFGTANIMFVSVKERTFLIGIEKALGSPKYFILSQFLGESVILCLLGGIIGLLLVLIVILIVNSFAAITLVLTMKNVLIGVSLSMLIGVMAGFIPALQASRLDPVDAIRNNF